jgi:hypothetical protein
MLMTVQESVWGLRTKRFCSAMIRICLAFYAAAKCIM